MSTKQFSLPDLGEGLTESEIVAWKVAVGDTVTLNQVDVGGIREGSYVRVYDGRAWAR